MSEGVREGRIPVIDEDLQGEEILEAEAVETTAEETAALRQELGELRERSTRALADFENYRKRVERDRREERRYGALGLAAGVLAVVDNLERALEAGGTVEDLKAGVEMTLRQLREVLEQHHIRRVAAIGQPFDPNLHEAVSRHEEPATLEPTVAEELQAGYTLHERLVRPAVVTVALPPSGDPPGGDQEEPQS